MSAPTKLVTCHGEDSHETVNPTDSSRLKVDCCDTTRDSAFESVSYPDELTFAMDNDLDQPVDNDGEKDMDHYSINRSSSPLVERSRLHVHPLDSGVDDDQDVVFGLPDDLSIENSDRLGALDNLPDVVQTIHPGRGRSHSLPNHLPLHDMIAENLREIGDDIERQRTQNNRTRPVSVSFSFPLTPGDMYRYCRRTISSVSSSMSMRIWKSSDNDN